MIILGRHRKDCQCDICKGKKPENQNDDTETGIILEKFPELSKEDISKLDVEKVNNYYEVLSKMDDEKLKKVLLLLNSNFEGQYNTDNENIFAVKRFMKEKNKTDWMNKLFLENKGKKVTKYYDIEGKCKDVLIEGLGNLRPSINAKDIKEKVLETEIKPKEVEDEYEKLKGDLQKELTEKAQSKEKDIEQLENMKGDLENLQEKIDKEKFTVSDHLREMMTDYMKKISKTIVSFEVTIAKRLTGKIPRLEIKENLIEAWDMFFNVYLELDLEKIIKYLPIIFLLIAHIDFVIDVLPDKEKKETEKKEISKKENAKKEISKKENTKKENTKEIKIDPLKKKIVGKSGKK